MNYGVVNGGKRIRLKDPVVDNYQINNIEYIHLKVVIDENGRPVDSVSPN